MPELCVINGDGIGAEVIPAAVAVLKNIIPDLHTIDAQAGWNCFLETGKSVPDETLEKINRCKAALFGAVSSPARKVEGYRSAIITMRQELDLYSNIRPVRSLPHVSPKEDIDLIIVRENTEGMYSGREHQNGDTAIAERVITRQASDRIGRRALDLLCQSGMKRFTIVHKANILPITDGLFRDTVREAVADVSSDILVDELLVDVAAMKLAAEPENFNIVVTTNLFGDILSDITSNWCGGLGLAPSINWGDGIAIAEPVHGSAPDIAGKNIANPIASILSAALLVRYIWQLPEKADQIEVAVNQTIENDLIIENKKISPLNTTDKILSCILQRLS